MLLSTPEAYRKVAIIHISKGEEVEWEGVNKVTTLINRTSKQIVKMFGVGKNVSESQMGRIVKGVTAKDTNPPPVSFLWKTHKEYDDIPPTRPVCNASTGPISRTSELLSMILNPLINSRENPFDSDST